MSDSEPGFPVEPATMPAGIPPAPRLRPAVFFDRDNTLLVGADYLGDPREATLVPGAADLIAGARRLGFATVVVSNQSGVARGYFTEHDVRAVNSRLDQLLIRDDADAVVDRHDFCPHHPTHGVAPYRQACQCRKPKDGMLRRSATTLGIDLGQSWLVGDAPRDVEAGRSAGCRTILVTLDGVAPSPAAREMTRVAPDFKVGSLREALDTIRREVGSFAAAPADTPGEASVALAPAAADARGRFIIEPTTNPTEGDDLRDLLPDSTTGGDVSARDFADGDDEDVNDEAASDSGESGDGRSTHERMLERLISQTESEPEVDAPAIRGLTAFADRPDQPAPHSSDDRTDDRAGVFPLSGASAPLAGPAADRIATTTAQILEDLRRQREAPREDFNLFRLLAGVVQVLALAAVVWALVRDFETARLVLGVFLQLLTITLLFASKPNA